MAVAGEEAAARGAACEGETDGTDLDPKAQPSTEPGAGCVSPAPKELYAQDELGELASQYAQYAVAGGVVAQFAFCGRPEIWQTKFVPYLGTGCGPKCARTSASHPDAGDDAHPTCTP